MGELQTEMFAVSLFFIIKEEVDLPRIARKDLGSPFFHVMVQGVNKEYIFFYNDYIERYLEIIERYRYVTRDVLKMHMHF